MAFKNTITIGVLSKCLRFAILQNKPHIFLPYLLSKHVDTTFSNKLRFYDFLYTRYVMHIKFPKDQCI